jgi:hypothetical protein
MYAHRFCIQILPEYLGFNCVSLNFEEPLPVFKAFFQGLKDDDHQRNKHQQLSVCHARESPYDATLSCDSYQRIHLA